MLTGNHMPIFEDEYKLLIDSIKKIEVIKAQILTLEDSLNTINSKLALLERPFLNTDQACSYLGIAVSTLRLYCQQRRFPFYSAGKINYFLKEDLDKFILDKANRVAPLSEIRSTAVTASKLKNK